MPGSTWSAFGIVVIASVTAALIGRAAFGNVPSFPLPVYQTLHVTEFPFYALYALLGVLGALAGVVFTRVLY